MHYQQLRNKSRGYTEPFEQICRTQLSDACVFWQQCDVATSAGGHVLVKNLFCVEPYWWFMSSELIQNQTIPKISWIMIHQKLGLVPALLGRRKKIGPYSGIRMSLANPPSLLSAHTLIMEFKRLLGELGTDPGLHFCDRELALRGSKMETMKWTCGRSNWSQLVNGGNLLMMPALVALLRLTIFTRHW